MKKWIAFIVTILLMSVAATAFATTATEWSQQCLYKVSGSATVYELSPLEATTTDLDSTDAYEFLPVNSISNAYVKVLDAEVDGKTAIFYLDSSGTVQEGYVNTSAISYVGVRLDIGIGSNVTVPQAIATDAQAIYEYVLVTYNVEANLEFIREGINAYKNSSSTATGTGSSSKTAEVAEKVIFYLVDENGDAQLVTMETLGTVYSTVKLDGESILVRTADLQWESEAEEAQALALINAPRTGEASLRAKASSKGSVLLKCDTNRVVLVLKVGKNYSRVLYEDTVGYVLTSALTFCPVGYVDEADDVQISRGWITFRGKLDSNNTINVRMTASGNSRILDDFKAGTSITIFEVGEKWAEIEVEGYHCYILSEYVTIDDSAEEEPEVEEEIEEEIEDDPNSIAAGENGADGFTDDEEEFYQQ